MQFFVGLFIGIIVGLIWGWVYAHTAIAGECKKLGGFYVNDEVFECRLQTNKKKRK